MGWISEDTIILSLKLLDQIIMLYIGYKIIRHLIKFGIDYFLERKRAKGGAYSPEDKDYQTVKLTHEELDQISFALNTRIDNLRTAIKDDKGTDGISILGRTLETCISAQKQTTYAGQPEKYKFREGDR